MMKKLLFSLLVLLLIASCNFERINMPEDKEDAERVAIEYYKHISSKDYNKIIPLLSDSFLIVFSSNSFINLMDTVQKQNGMLKKYDLIKHQSFVKNGTNPVGNYWLLYDAEYENFHKQEMFYLRRDKDGKLRIYSMDAKRI